MPLDDVLNLIFKAEMNALLQDNVLLLGFLEDTRKYTNIMKHTLEDRSIKGDEQWMRDMLDHEWGEFEFSLQIQQARIVEEISRRFSFDGKHIISFLLITGCDYLRDEIDFYMKYKWPDASFFALSPKNS